MARAEGEKKKRGRPAKATVQVNDTQSSTKGAGSQQSDALVGFEAKLWQMADKLRNNMDAAEYKHVVLGLIFLKYISDAFEEKHAAREWIDVLGRLGDLSPNVEKFGHALRDFRNYVHPAEQLGHRFSPDRHTARIGFQVVVAAIEDLARACGAEAGVS